MSQKSPSSALSGLSSKSNGGGKTTLISITTNNESGSMRPSASSSRRPTATATAEMNRDIMKQNSKIARLNESEQLEPEDEYGMDEESGLDDFGQEEFLDGGRLSMAGTSMTARAGSSRGLHYSALDPAEWGGSSDESPGRMYDGEVDDETLNEFGMNMEEGSTAPSGRRRR